MLQVLSIVKSTPVYVWAILVYLLYMGIKATKRRVVWIPRLFIMPVIFLCLKYKIFLSRECILFITITLASLICSFIYYSKITVKIIKVSRSIELEGSYSAIIILIFIFTIKYFFGYLNIAMPEIATKYSIFDLLISGMFSGYLFGRFFQYLYKYHSS